VVVGLLGLSVGFIKGGLWLACWLGAIVATLYGYPYVQPAAAAWLKNRDIIGNPFLADLAVGAGIFFASLIFLFMVSSVVTTWVRTSRLNALDRSLGLLAGLIAGCLIVSAAYIPFSSQWTREEDQPAFLRDARLRPLIEWGADLLQTLAPGELGGERAVDDHIRSGDADPAYEVLARPPQPAAAPEADTGYTGREREDMNRLLQSSTGP
jgi:membrane protein required for colicin V production